MSAMLVLSMLSPLATVALADGKKHFKRGMEHEAAQEWDKAVEEFAIAVNENPKSPEYRLHLIRALFNASQMYIKKGTNAAKESDYQSAYASFRRAYGYDPTNELAKSEMDRMVRMIKAANGEGTDKKAETVGLKLVPTGYTTGSPTAAVPQIPQKLEQLRDLPFPSGVDLQFIIKELAKDLDLNVLFDIESFRTQGRKTFIDLKNVTAARALDYIFLQEGLFFQKVGPRTILVATQARRTQYQQLVLRTFYLANAAPKDIAKIVQTAIPAQPGRSQTIVLTDDATNSVTIRDTEENIKLIGKLISSLDKDRAEVVMDVAIYEVNKSDLLQFGNQIGNQSQLTQLGGSGQGVIRLGSSVLSAIATGGTATTLPLAIPTGILLPAANLSAFQSKNDTKLIASTQIHAFNNEDSSARIGQRVPVQSAQFVTGAGGNNGNGIVSNVINYEQVGLTLKFKPLVFPNQDVQVAMEIESKDVAGASTLTPTFTERTIKGTARVQNNKTLLLASVAQGVETKGKQGLPLLGLIPIIGRLFTAPTRDNRQVDIVIAVTPRVIRAPAILPDDETERPTGSLAVPTNNSLEAMIIEEERDEMLAAARRNSANAVVQLPDRPVETLEYVKADAPVAADKPDATATAAVATDVAAKSSDLAVVKLKPIDNSIKTLQLKQTSDTVEKTEPTDTAIAVPAETASEPKRSVAVSFGAELPEMKAGNLLKVPVVIDGTGAFSSGVIGLKFDEKKLAVRNVFFGDAFGGKLAGTIATPFLNQNGKMYVSLTTKDGSEVAASGTLAVIEVEVLADGKPVIAFDGEVLNFLSSDGKNFTVKVQ